MTQANTKTVQSDMDDRRLFDNPESATAYLQACAESFSDFGDVPFVGNGVSPEGDFDPEVYTDETRVMVGTLANRVDTGKRTSDGKIIRAEVVKCIYVTPVPTLDALLKDDTGSAWTIGILDKEFAHVAVRNLRTAEVLDGIADIMPKTRADFITSQRTAGGGVMEAFNDLYKEVSDFLASARVVWFRAKLRKDDLRKCLESKEYAETAGFTALENNGDEGSLFVVFLNMASKIAEQRGLDSTIFQRWLETRNNKSIEAPAQGEDADIDFGDLDALVGDMLAADDS